MLRTGYVTVNNVSSRLITCGGWLDEAFPDDQGRREMVFIIPGNPGLTQYYEDFVEHLYEELGIPVWCLCHAGHELDMTAKIPSTRKNPQLYNVKGQIAHKVEFIEKYIPQNTGVYLIGHSVGAYIIMNLMRALMDRNLTINVTIIRSYLLFPALKDIGRTPNGRVYQFFANNFLWLILLLSRIYCLLPYFLQYALVSCFFFFQGTDQKNVPATMHLIQPKVLNNIFHMASDEMNVIKDLDSKVIQHCHDKITFYFGKSDGWSPLQHYSDLKNEHPQADAVVCEKGFRHAFVLNSSQGMAQILGSWIGKTCSESSATSTELPATKRKLRSMTKREKE